MLNLESEKETLEIAIAKEKIERPIVSKEDIRYWICRFGATDLDDIEEKQRLIDVFLNSLYVYDDKMLIVLNYKDGEICVTFDEIREMMNKKTNPDNHNDYQGSPLEVNGEPSAARTPDTLIKSQSCR